MSTPSMQTLEVPVSDLNNDMLGHLHHLGCAIYAVHAKNREVLIFSRALPLDEPLALVPSPDGMAAPPGG